MNALLNAHNQREHDDSLRSGLTSLALPEAYSSHTGVSLDYIPKPDHHWFVLRVVYNRVSQAYGIINNAKVRAYMPMHYVMAKEIGKKKRILSPLLPNLFFVYTTREQANALVHRQGNKPSVVKYYLDKTKARESNGKHPPLIIPVDSMTSFIRATSTESEHVRIVSAEQCHYKSGETVKVIKGEFEGVIGKVARIAGQQRVVVEIAGLCLVATAYIPNAFLEKKE